MLAEVTVGAATLGAAVCAAPVPGLSAVPDVPGL